MWANQYEIEKTFMGRLSHNGDLLDEINTFCIQNDIKTGWVSVIGAVKTVKLGYYKQTEKEYVFLNDICADKPFEIINCTGNISLKDGKPFAHLHIVVSDREGKCTGGHLMPGTIIFAGEFIIQKFKGNDLIRGADSETGLPLWVK